jgi:hypothetical protein
VAVIMTTAGGVAIALPLVIVNRAFNLRLASDNTGEIITYIQPVRQGISSKRSLSGAFHAVSAVRRSAPIEPVGVRDTSSLSPSESVSNAVADTVPRSGRSVSTATRALGAFPATVGVNPSYWSATYKSLLDPADFLRRRPLTAAQRDSAEREMERRTRESRDEHRPMAIPLAGASLAVGLPMFTHVPSREERARDSVINADNLQRLARLAARARAKHDSLLAANSP